MTTSHVFEPTIQMAGRDEQFTSESVTEGHPDKLADQISDRILDEAITRDRHSRVAIETAVTANLVVVLGETRTDADLDIDAYVRDVLRQVGYTFDPRFHADTVEVKIAVGDQSSDIARGVDAAREAREFGSTDEVDLEGAGDQGMMFGYATSETPEMMPMPMAIARRLSNRLTAVRKAGLLPYLRPDGKTQVTVRYVGGEPVEIVNVLISTHHAKGVDRDTRIRPDLIEHVIKPELPPGMYDASLFERVMVNPTGVFENGGPPADAGLTGRKIIVDTYGGRARHGGGAFSGKDPSKVDRSGAYAARWVAKNVVAAGLADRCEIQVAYAIGVAHPISILVETFGTEHVDRELIDRLVRERFDLRPLAFRRELDLHRPIYAKTAASGHFGRADSDFTWEQTTKADELRRAARTGTTGRLFDQAN
jgi:S-adenosylmethionine synthetase